MVFQVFRRRIHPLPKHCGTWRQFASKRRVYTTHIVFLHIPNYEYGWDMATGTDESI